MQTAMVGRLGLTILILAALTGVASAAGADSRDPKKRFNAADQAWAHGIRISRNDLGAGDWRVEPSAAKTVELAGCKQPNLSDLVLTGEAKNPDFSRNGSFVSSEAEVWASERDAGKSWSRSVSWPIQRCLIASLRQGMGADPRVTLTVLSSGRLPVAKLAPRTLAYAVGFRIKGPGGAVSGRIAVYAFGRGRAEGSLVLVSLGKPAQPIPAALEHRLAGLVAQRLQR
jgi:hypothetical protein